MSQTVKEKYAAVRAARCPGRKRNDYAYNMKRMFRGIRTRRTSFMLFEQTRRERSETIIWCGQYARQENARLMAERLAGKKS